MSAGRIGLRAIITGVINIEYRPPPHCIDHLNDNSGTCSTNKTAARIFGYSGRSRAFQVEMYEESAHDVVDPVVKGRKV